jgi:hypothetical protein
MSIVKRYATRAMLTMVLAVSAMGLVVTPANAGGYPIAYRQAGNHWSPMMGIPNGNVVQAWLAPGEQFVMQCYVDTYYGSTGNYFSHRWYRGQSWNHGFGYIHSSYIYYQWNVPPC